jgi:hypothetical protein
MNEAAIWAGADELRSRLVPIADLTRHPDNPRRGDVDEIVKSLGRFGQVRPILIDDAQTVIAGNHTLLAAESLGWTHVAAVVNAFGSPEDAKAYLLADNRLSDLGEFDRAELALLVAELETSGRWDGTGYTADDLDHMRAMQAARDTVLPPPEPVVPVDPAAPPGMREVVLLFDEAQQQEFGGHVRALRARYGLEGVTDTVLKALHDEALLVNQGAPA